MCQASCAGPIPASPAERARVAAVGKPLPIFPVACANLTDAGRCGVYADRPMICRLWGVVENMPCPHGCRPDGGLLSRTEGAAILASWVDRVGEAT